MDKENSSARFWDKLAIKYSKKPVPDEAIYQRKIQLTQKYFSADDVVFEFGCGTGSTALLHAPKVERIDATDISPAMIAIAKERARSAKISNVSFKVGEISDFELAPQSYDGILGLNIMHLIDNPAATLSEVHRILKADGIFVSSTPLLKNEPIIVRWIIKFMQAIGRAPYINLLTKDNYLKLISDAGFEPVHAWMPTKTCLFLIARKPIATKQQDTSSYSLYRGQ